MPRHHTTTLPHRHNIICGRYFYLLCPRLLFACLPVVRLLFIVLLLITQNNTANAQPATSFSPQQIAILQAASAYLQSIDGLRGRFTQIDPQGATKSGQFLLKRPGMLKFAYDAPSTVQIIIRDDMIAIQEAPGAAPERYPIAATPLPLFFNADVDLTKSDSIADVLYIGGQAEIMLEDSSGKIPGQISMRFTYPQMSLRGWRVIDAQGQVIIILLHDQRAVSDIDNAVFKFDYKRRRTIRK